VLTYSRPPYRRDLEPSRLSSLVMITRAPVTCLARRLGLVHWSHACTTRWQIWRSGCGVVSRHPIRPQEGTGFGRGLDAVQRPNIRSANLGCLEGVPIRRPILVSRVLTRPGSFGGEGCKKNDGTGPCYHASRDHCVRWECGGRIKCPGSRARVRRRTVSLRSTLLDSLGPVSVFDGSWRSTLDRFA